jgi:hypothetical protein
VQALYSHLLTRRANGKFVLELSPAQVGALMERFMEVDRVAAASVC